jgi:hypothetical protein
VFPYLSVVAVSRNDDHGGDPLFRTQVFVDSLAEQCERFRVTCELVLVDWNPPDERCGLRDAIRWPKHGDFFSARVIEVPPSVHRSIRGSTALPLFQMIGKNVGIRRATGQFILATNIDIVFSDEVFAFFSTNEMEERRLYRCDRYDSQSGVPHPATASTRQQYLAAHCIRKNCRFGSQVFDASSGGVAASSPGDIPQSPYVEAIATRGGVTLVTIRQDCPAEHLHTNGCGDFTLMSNEDWSRLRGYAEFEAFSFHIDSLLVYTAHYSGIVETSFLAPAVVYHLEHSAGSGWTPEGEQKLFDRIERLGLPSMSYPLLRWILRKCRSNGDVITFNRKDWGMASRRLREFELSGEKMVEKNRVSVEHMGDGAPIAAIRDEWQYYKVYSEFLREELEASQSKSFRRVKRVFEAARSGGLRSLWQRRSLIGHRVVGNVTAYISLVLRSNFPRVMKYTDRYRSRELK